MAGISNKGRKAYFCATAQTAALTQLEYEALTWVEVDCIINIGETGSSPNIISQNCWGSDVTQKQVGILDAGDPTVEVAVIPTDPGQIAMRSVANDGNYYAFKIENRLVGAQTTPRTEYNRGLVLGPTSSNGGVEDWNNETFTLGLVQERIVVEAT